MVISRVVARVPVSHGHGDTGIFPCTRTHGHGKFLHGRTDTGPCDPCHTDTEKFTRRHGHVRGHGPCGACHMGTENVCTDKVRVARTRKIMI